MKLLATFVLMVGLHAIVAVAQKPNNAAQEREALCRTVACREAATIKLKGDDKRYAEFSFPRGPFVAEGFINILNGERFGVEFEEKDGKLTAPHYVKEIEHADRTLSFELSPLENGTLLTIANPFPQAIVYDCMIQHYKQTGFGESTVLPVKARLKTLESWPYPIPQVVISNVHYQSQPAGGMGSGSDIGSQDHPSSRRFTISSNPDAAKGAAEVDVVITVSAVFTREGLVASIKVIGVKPEHFAAQDVINRFKKKAIQYAKTIKFQTAEKDGHAVSQYMQLEYSFKLCGDKECDDDKKSSAPSN